MNITKLDNGELVVHTDDQKACVVFNKKMENVKYIELYVKGGKLFAGRDALYIMQDILGEINTFASTLILLAISAITVNIIDFSLIMNAIIFIANIFVALKCLISFDLARQSITCAYLDNQLNNLFDSNEE